MNLLSVTEILKMAGVVDDRWFNDAARDRGSALHAATAYLDEGTLKRETVSESILARFEQYERFLVETNVQILEIEQEVINDVYGYIGHLDRLVQINGSMGILDIKPGPAPWHGLQLAGYAGCFPPPMKRWALHITDTSYKLVEYKDRNDWRDFLGCLTVAQWHRRQANGR